MAFDAALYSIMMSHICPTTRPSRDLKSAKLVIRRHFFLCASKIEDLIWSSKNRNSSVLTWSFFDVKPLKSSHVGTVPVPRGGPDVEDSTSAATHASHVAYNCGSGNTMIECFSENPSQNFTFLLQKKPKKITKMLLALFIGCVSMNVWYSCKLRVCCWAWLMAVPVEKHAWEWCMPVEVS